VNAEAGYVVALTFTCVQQEGEDLSHDEISKTSSQGNRCIKLNRSSDRQLPPVFPELDFSYCCNSVNSKTSLFLKE